MKNVSKAENLTYMISFNTKEETYSTFDVRSNILQFVVDFTASNVIGKLQNRDFLLETLIENILESIEEEK